MSYVDTTAIHLSITQYQWLNCFLDLHEIRYSSALKKDVKQV